MKFHLTGRMDGEEKFSGLTSANGEVCEEELSEELKNDYIGGAAINARMLYDALRENIEADPLGPENPLIFGFGILVGTSFPCTSRFTVTAKSPVTNIFGDSNAGGFFPVRIKQAGYDHIIIEGTVRIPRWPCS